MKRLRALILEMLDPRNKALDAVKRYGERFGYEFRPDQGLVSPHSWRMQVDDDGKIVGYGYPPYPDVMDLSVADLEDAIKNGVDLVIEPAPVRAHHPQRRQGPMSDEEWEEVMGAPLDDIESLASHPELTKKRGGRVSN